MVFTCRHPASWGLRASVCRQNDDDVVFYFCMQCMYVLCMQCMYVSYKLFVTRGSVSQVLCV